MLQLVAISLFIVNCLFVSSHAYSVGGGVYPNSNNGGGGNGVAGSYCNSNADCQYGLQCTPSVNGVKICLQGGYNPGGGTGTCAGNYQCPQGQTCTYSNGQYRCQINVGGYVPGSGTGLGTVDTACLRDADCSEDLQCTRYFGVLQCRPKDIDPPLPSGFIKCETDMDCPNSKPICDWSSFYKVKICYAYTETLATPPPENRVTDSIVGENGYVVAGGYITTPEPFQLSTGGRIIAGYATSTLKPITSTQAILSTTSYEIGKGVEPRRPMQIGDGVEKKPEIIDESIAEFSNDKFDDKFYRPYGKQVESDKPEDAYRPYPVLLANVDENQGELIPYAIRAHV
ncbi:hypothetical protein WR25_25927 [Diploscapter pachys]|uniref:EB domain-containing protein n=1 Tax=Diploscapter pachys TaxID=2018661 RepID=A0A2A2KS14_9BILA|nr:hypothetical protein WR25_25927 [Diploscapter pachys]